MSIFQTQQTNKERLEAVKTAREYVKQFNMNLTADDVHGFWLSEFTGQGYMKRYVPNLGDVVNVANYINLYGWE